MGEMRGFSRNLRTFFLTMGDITSKPYMQTFPFFSHQNYEVHQSTTKVVKVKGLLRNQPRNVSVREIIENGVLAAWTKMYIPSSL